MGLPIPERPQTTVCAAVARPLRPSRGAAEMTGRCEGCARPPSRRACGTGRGAWPRRVRKQGAEARRRGVLEPRAEAPGRESTRRLSRRRSPLRSAAEWAGREPTSSRSTAWCRAALEPRRSARTPPGRRPSQPPSSRLNRTGSCPPARLRTARPAGSRGGRSAGRGESARHAECGRCRPVTRLQLCRRRSLFILSERATSKTCDPKR